MADSKEVLRNQDGEACNRAGQKIDAHGLVIPFEVVFVGDNGDAGPVRWRKIGDYNRPYQFNGKRSAIKAPPFQRNGS